MVIFYISNDSLMGKEGRKVLFNDILNTFYLRLHDIRYMVYRTTQTARQNLLLPLHGLLFSSSKGSFICTIPYRIAPTVAFVTPVVKHWQ